MNNPFQKQPQPTENLTTPPDRNETPIIAPEIVLRSADPTPTTAAQTTPQTRPPSERPPHLEISHAGPIYPPEAVDLYTFNNLFYEGSSLEDIRNLFSKQIVIDNETTISVNTLTVPGFIGISDNLGISDPKGNGASGYADIAAILKTEDLLICTYQNNRETYGQAIDLNIDAGQSKEISSTINRYIEGNFKGTLEGTVSETFSGNFSGHIELMPNTAQGSPVLKLKGTYDGLLKGKFDGTLQGQLLATTIPFDPLLIQDTVIKNGGFHTSAIVPARQKEAPTVEAFASFNQSDNSYSGLYGESDHVAVAQRLVFDKVITPEEARGYRHSIINWMGLLSHITRFSEGNIDGGDPTTVVDPATLKAILRNGVRASLGYPDALNFFDKPDNKLYCAEFIYIALNTPLFPFNQLGLTELLDGDSATAAAVLEHQNRYANHQFDIFSLVRWFKNNDPHAPEGNPQLIQRNILLPPVAATLLPIDQLLTQRSRAVDGLPFPPFTIAQVIRRAFRTLLPRQGTLETSKLAKLQARLFKAIEPMLTQQVLPKVDHSNLTEEAAAEIQADPRVMQVKAFIAQVEDTLTQAADAVELDRRFDEIVEQANSLVRQARSLVEFVPPRIYVDLGQQDGDNNLPKGWGFHLETIGATIARESINGTVTVAESLPADAADNNSSNL